VEAEAEAEERARLGRVKFRRREWERSFDAPFSVSIKAIR
jgi:hypothetical protein